MAEFTHDGFTYDLWIKPWKKGNKRYEAIRWETGLKCTWERISYELFLKMRAEKLKTKMKNSTCAHKYKIGKNVYCKIRVDDCSFCSCAVSKCKHAERIPTQSNRAYHSFTENQIVHKSGRNF